ncbi:MAG: glycine-rich protein [Bacteroidota bacterium]
MKLLGNKFILLALAIFSLTLGEAWGVASFAQNVGINTTGNAPNSSALLDINASPGNNKGVLIPRLPLTAANNGAPISPLPGVSETGLMVFNTATAGVAPNDVVPGFYYWNGTAWAPLGAGGSTAGGWTDDGTVVRLTTSTDFVGIGTASPAATSALDITSTTKGILIPRMTTAQRDAITTPATGLQVYNTDCKSLNYYTGTCWIALSKSLPDPGIITSTPATTVFCAGQVRAYSIPAVPGATSYTWSVPAGTSITSGNGTTSISATFGNISGDVCVKASNACETSGKTCLAVSVDPIPNTPGNITGITSINPGQNSVTYFVASVNGASTYTWTVPTGATITSGTGTTTIVVNFACNASSGNISVTANSTCGSSPASALALTITPLLSVSAGAAVFGGTTQTIGNAATGGTPGYTYAWLPTANLSASNIANPIAQCAGSTDTYTITVTDTRSCTATSTVVVTRNLAASAGGNLTGPGAIGGAPTATGGAGSYTYSWTTPTELSSSTIANPNAKACNTTTFTVTVTDANSCTAASSVTVTKNLAATIAANRTCSPGTVGGTATGGAGSYTYAWTGAGLSATNIANPNSTAAVTTTNGVTVTDANNCTATGSITITLPVTTPALQLFGASVFTINNTSTGYTGNIQRFVVPCGITSITIEAWGAEGGKASGYAELPGKGARMKGTFAVTPGQVLKILVGQQGEFGSNDGGGGGGTFVTDNSNVPLIIAGGGGGSSYTAPRAGIDGTTANSGTAGQSGGAGGSGGNGGTSGGYSGGGGGLTGNGGNGPSSGQCGGTSFVNGGDGGTTGSACRGGFGGGGGTHGGGWGGGGGGGYSGGGASNSSQYGGGGGGSYNVGTAQSNTSGVKSGHGQVQITY